MTAYSYVKRGNILSKTKVYDDVTLPAETTSFSYGNMEFEWTNGLR